MNTLDTTREAFESHFKFLDYSKKRDSWNREVYAREHIQCMWDGWQASTEAQSSTIAKLEQEVSKYKSLANTGASMLGDLEKRTVKTELALKETREALWKASEKLRIYRSNTNGEYQGGMEYTQLMELIENTLAIEAK